MSALRAAPPTLRFCGAGDSQPLEIALVPTGDGDDCVAALVVFRLRVNDRAALTVGRLCGVLNAATVPRTTINVRCEDPTQLGRCIVLLQWLEVGAGEMGAWRERPPEHAELAKHFVAHAAAVRYAVVHCGLVDGATGAAAATPPRMPRIRLGSGSLDGSVSFESPPLPATPRLSTPPSPPVPASPSPSPPPAPRRECCSDSGGGVGGGSEGVERRGVSRSAVEQAVTARSAEVEDSGSTPAPECVREQQRAVDAEPAPLSQRLAAFVMTAGALLLLRLRNAPAVS